MHLKHILAFSDLKDIILTIRSYFDNISKIKDLGKYFPRIKVNNYITICHKDDSD